MRIIAGDYKGRVLKAPKTRATRPTSDRARETLFNVLGHADWAPGFEGAQVLDLFAGSGALGFEALSRGGGRAVFVDNTRPAQQAIKDNITALKLGARANLLNRNATSLGPREAVSDAPFDLIFLDPPYGKKLVEPCLTSLIAGGWAGPESLIIAETGAKETLNWQDIDADGAGLDCVKQKPSGAAKFWFLRMAF